MEDDNSPSMVFVRFSIRLLGIGNKNHDSDHRLFVVASMEIGFSSPLLLLLLLINRSTSSTFSFLLHFFGTS
jgi:hypothetical protein